MNPVDRIARMAEVEMWLGDGLNLRITPPRGDQPFFVALAPDIRLAALGMTEQEAIQGMFSIIERLIDDFLSEGKPLLPRKPSPDDAASNRDEQ